MRYYCKNCGTEMSFKMGTVGCPYCKSFKFWERIPDYETPEQYEKRTGEPLRDDAAVWVQFYDEEDDRWLDWNLMRYGMLKNIKRNNAIHNDGDEDKGIRAFVGSNVPYPQNKKRRKSK